MSIDSDRILEHANLRLEDAEQLAAQVADDIHGATAKQVAHLAMVEAKAGRHLAAYLFDCAERLMAEDAEEESEEQDDRRGEDDE